MPITPLPFLDRTLPTFKSDTDKFFGVQLPQFSVDINALASEVDADASAAAASQAAAKTSETNAGNSASAANTSKNAAATSASQAAGSATTASDKASAASGSATAAANSATAAGTSATNAGNSATAAGTSATNAKTSETNSKTSETNAASSATAAAASKSGADTAKTAAETAATTATNKATAASDSAAAALASKNAAGTSATNAADSASSALSSKNAASTSASNAADSAAAAAASAQNASAGGVKSVNQKTPNTQGAVVLVASDLGLGNVNNTADSAKPVSTLQAQAIALKANKAGDTFTGEMTYTGLQTIRMINQTGEYGAFWRGDASALYLLMTAKNDAPTGTFTTARPLTLDYATGLLSINGTSEIAGKLRTARRIGGTLFDGTQDVGINAQWIGNAAVNMPTGTSAYSATDAALLVDGIYGGLAKGYPIDFGNRMQIRGSGLSVTEIYHEWINGQTRMFVRARGDVNTHQWTNPEQVAFVSMLPSQARNAPMTGLNKQNLPVLPTDSLITAMGKVQGQIENVDGFDSRLMWQFPGQRENWTATGGNQTFTRAGVMTLTPTTGDCFMVSPSPLSIAGNVYGKIRAKITRISGANWDGTAYYVTSGHAVNPSFSKAVPNPNLAVGQSAIIEWDMWALTTGGDDWFNSTINQIRLDLGASVDDVFDIDYITVGRTGPTEKQVVGPVSVAVGGLLTGAIIEAGSNTNGFYTKFADGTMICGGTIAANLTTSTQDANAWFSPSASFTFAAPFFSVISITYSAINVAGYYAFGASDGATSLSSSNARLVSFVSNVTGKISYTVYGRWK